MEPTTIGLVENIILYGKKKSKHVKARIDTGATKGSIDTRLAAEIGLGPTLKTKVVRSASGVSVRPMIKADVSLASRKVSGLFTLVNRTNLKYRALIGQNILKQGFVIDPNK